MREIKTIKNWLDNTDYFDAEVNAALRDGWQLIRRTILRLQAPTEQTYTHIMLLAELEKHYITEAERCCDNPAQAEPCSLCNDASEWEDMES